MQQRELKVRKEDTPQNESISHVNLGNKTTSVHRNDESDDDLPSLEELFRTAPLPNVSTEASKTENPFEYLKHLPPGAAGRLLDQTKSELGGRQGDSPGK